MNNDNNNSATKSSSYGKPHVPAVPMKGSVLRIAIPTRVDDYEQAGVKALPPTGQTQTQVKSQTTTSQQQRLASQKMPWRPGTAWARTSKDASASLEKANAQQKQHMPSLRMPREIRAQGYGVRTRRPSSSGEGIPRRLYEKRNVIANANANANDDEDSIDDDDANAFWSPQKQAQTPTTATLSTNVSRRMPPPHGILEQRHHNAHTTFDTVPLPSEGRPHVPFESFVVDFTAAAVADANMPRGTAANAARNLYSARRSPLDEQHPPRPSTAPPPPMPHDGDPLTAEERAALARVRAVLSVARDASSIADGATPVNELGAVARLTKANKRVFSPSKQMRPTTEEVEDRTPATRFDAVALLHSLKQQNERLNAPREIADSRMWDAASACRDAHAPDASPVETPGTSEMDRFRAMQAAAAERFQAVYGAWQGAESRIDGVFEELAMLEQCALELSRQVSVTCAERGQVTTRVMGRMSTIAREALGCVARLAHVIDDASAMREHSERIRRDAEKELGDARRDEHEASTRASELEEELEQTKLELNEAKEQIKRGASGYIKAEVMRAKALMEGQLMTYERDMMRRNEKDFKREMNIMQTEMRGALHNQTSAFSEMFRVRDEIMANVQDLRSDILELSDGKVGKMVRANANSGDSHRMMSSGRRPTIHKEVQTMSESTFSAVAENLDGGGPWAGASMPRKKGKGGAGSAKGKRGGGNKETGSPRARAVGQMSKSVMHQYSIPPRVAALLPNIGADYSPKLRSTSFVRDHLAMLLRDYQNYLRAESDRKPGMPLLPPYDSTSGLLRACSSGTPHATAAESKCADTLCSAKVGAVRDAEGQFQDDDGAACWLLYNACCDDALPVSILTFWVRCEELFDSEKMAGTTVPPQCTPQVAEAKPSPQAAEVAWVHILRTQEAVATQLASAPASSSYKLLQALERYQVDGLIDVKGKVVPGVQRTRALGLLLSIWEEEQVRFKERLKLSFKEADSDGDGQLDFDEFRSLVRKVEPTADDRRVINMFLQGIGEGNSLSPATFADVVLKYGIMSL
ncbi:EF-hand domain-containing protein [Pseudoscourfieldia marina]